jgi:hypothetical protein
MAIHEYNEGWRTLRSKFTVLATCGLIASAFGCAASGQQTEKDKEDTASKIQSAPIEFESDGNTAIERIDINADDKPDVFKFYRLIDPNAKNLKEAKKVLVRKELDVNFDQRFDIVQYYTGKPNKEILVREELDLDFDGRIDSTRHYKDGHLRLVELDLGFDGKTDTWRYYQLTKNDQGKTVNRLIEKRRDENGNGSIDVWEYFTKGELTKIGYDTTGDGSPDRFKKINK